jgi:hypothetical protein
MVVSALHAGHASGNEVFTGNGGKKIVREDGGVFRVSQQGLKGLVFLMEFAAGGEPEPPAGTFEEGEGGPAHLLVGVWFLI